MNKAGRICLLSFGGLALVAGFFGLIYAGNKMAQELAHEQTSLGSSSSGSASVTNSSSSGDSSNSNSPSITLSTRSLVFEKGAGFDSTSKTVTATVTHSYSSVSWRVDPAEYGSIVSGSTTSSGDALTVSIDYTFKGSVTIYAALTDLPAVRTSCVVTAVNHAERAQLKEFALRKTGEITYSAWADFGLVGSTTKYGEGYYFAASNLEYSSKYLPTTYAEAIALPQAGKITASPRDLILDLNVWSSLYYETPYKPSQQTADVLLDQANSTWKPSSFEVSYGVLDSEHKYQLELVFHLSDADKNGGILAIHVDQFIYAFTLNPFVAATGVSVPGTTTVS
jgi:hypothetical protein